jgi:ribokinase
MPPSPPSIVVVGSANIDLVAYLDRTPGPGETVLGRTFNQRFGGKGANQAVMAARLGASVAFVGAVGDDAYAGQTIANFEAEGIDVGGLARVPGPSGLASIWVEPDGTNRIVVIAGANGLVSAAVAAGGIEAVDAVDVVIGQLEIPQAATAAAFRAAKAHGAMTILNPAPAAALDAELLTAADWLVPNEIELEQLAGGAISSDDDLLRYAGAAGRGLVVTLGAAGAAVVTADGVVRVPAPEVVAVDTVGAGDAFVGAFAAGLGLGLEPVEAVRLGIACASDSVTRPGAQASYPDRKGAAVLLGATLPPSRPDPG